MVAGGESRLPSGALQIPRSEKLKKKGPERLVVGSRQAGLVCVKGCRPTLTDESSPPFCDPGRQLLPKAVLEISPAKAQTLPHHGSGTGQACRAGTNIP